MTDNRNTILAVILSGLVLLGWQYFFNIPQMEKQRAAQLAQGQMTKPAQDAGSTAAPQGTTPAPSANAPSTVQAGSAAPVSRDTALAAAPRVKIDSPRLTGSISLKGARIDGVTELHQRQIVDTRAFQREAAADPRGIDLDARRRGNGGIAVDGGRGGDRLIGRRCVGRRRGGRPGCRGVRATGLRRGLRHFALGLLRGALLFQLRQVEEILPAEQHEAGQNDGEDGVAIIGHRSGLVIQFGWRWR